MEWCITRMAGSDTEREHLRIQHSLLMFVLFIV